MLTQNTFRFVFSIILFFSLLLIYFLWGDVVFDLKECQPT